MLRAWGGFVVTVALVAAAPTPAGAQAFVAAASRPDFTIGPLTVVATAPADVQDAVNVTVSWNLFTAGRAPARQDLMLLWPAEIAAGTAPGAADDGVSRWVLARGYSSVGSGRLTLRRRGMSQIGAPVPAEPIPVVASFVSFVRPDAPQAGTGSIIRIPWTPELGDPNWIVNLAMPVRGMIGPKPATWVEEFFWGRRNVLSIGWGDIGSVVFYPLYHEHRDRIVPLARDFSRLLVAFPDAEHLRIEGIEPATAVRRGSRLRAGTETVALPISAVADGAQGLRIQYAYYRGVFAWRPVLISIGLLILSNVAGLWMISGQVSQVLRARLRFGRALRTGGSERLTPERLAEIRPGDSTYDDVVRICGLPDEHHQRVADGGRRTLVYHATERRPERGLSLGWLATVRHWDIEHHDVEIEMDGDRVRDVVIRVRRTRTNAPD
ncbi:MAG TPA: hypothetical protein VGT02_07300 [Methylomirabilota bacterium]|jgi:hypothetical protein|nr:hypothetical protein [Methylomirabilota bacterium]